MAHEILIDGGRAAMMYAGEAPWHGLGTRVEGAATASEAITAAGLDWEVAKLPLYATNGMHGVPVIGKYATVRADKIGKPDCQAFGIVSESYTPLQNYEAFEFFDAIVKDRNAAMYHTAGALGIGERIWILAKLPGDIRVANDDITDRYLLLSNNHDGRAGVQIKFTPVRVVCNNTLTLALSQGGTISVPHFRDLDRRLSKAVDLLCIINHKYSEIEERFNDFANIRINTDRLHTYLKAVFPDPEDQYNVAGLKKAQLNRTCAEYLFDQGKGNQSKSVAGTLWAAYNGVTELIDHRVPSIKDDSGSRGASRRLSSLWFGQGSHIKARAFEIALDKLDHWKN
jgi:phage/plasmid-like protein (TIGR03299 family)